MAKNIIWTIFFVFIVTPLFSQNIGDSKFQIQLNEKNKFGGESSSFYSSYDELLTYVVAVEAHYIYYYIKDGICIGISEKVVGNDLRSTYDLYNNILASNDFGRVVSRHEDYTCFVKSGIKHRVSIKKSLIRKNSWDVFIDRGNEVQNTGKYGC